MSNKNQYELLPVPNDEMMFLYSTLNPERDKEIGCLGHLRADFVYAGSEFCTTWDNHCAEYITSTFKGEFDTVINGLRTGILRDYSTLSAYCYAHSQAKLNDGRDNEYGFKIKTDSHVYYLRCCTRQNDYNLYCYAYDRSRLEKVLSPPAPAAKRSLLDRLENNKERVAQNSQNGSVTRKKNDLEV